MTRTQDRDVAEIGQAFLDLLPGRNKYTCLVAMISAAVTTARLLGMPKMELQQMLVRIWDKRSISEREQAGGAATPGRYKAKEI